MNIIQLPLGEVHPYKNNPRKNDGAVDAVAESIRQYGFLVPLVISADVYKRQPENLVKICRSCHAQVHGLTRNFGGKES